MYTTFPRILQLVRTIIYVFTVSSEIICMIICCFFFSNNKGKRGERTITILSGCDHDNTFLLGATQEQGGSHTLAWSVAWGGPPPKPKVSPQNKK